MIDLDEDGRAPQGLQKTETCPKGMIEVIARHAIQSAEVKVTLPKCAKFKHVKRALQKHLGNDEIFTRGQLMKKQGGIYVAYKDGQCIGDVREVLVVCTDFNAQAGEQFEIAISDGEISAEEDSNKGVKNSTNVDDEGGRTMSRRGSGGKNPIITKKEALSLQRELYEGFKGVEFQRHLKELLQQQDDAIYTPSEFTQERQNLFLTVQRIVLPKYGFEGTLPGVYQMMGAMGPFLKDPEFTKLANDINELIGLDMPSKSWDNLSKSCQKIDSVPLDKNKKKSKSLPLPGHLGGMGVFQPRGLMGMGSPMFGGQMPGPAIIGSTPEARNVGGRNASTGDSTNTQTGTFEPWPPAKSPPFKLFVAGTFNEWTPAEMNWEEGLFVCPIEIGPNGSESFQILQNGKWEKTLHPNIADACPYEDHTVCGPDNKGHGLNWQIGKYAEDQAKPGAHFAIIVAMDVMGRVQAVAWQQF